MLAKQKRVDRQRGLFLVLIGPDGAGKSTVLAAAGPRLEEGFSGVWRFHWRPGLLPKLGRAGGSQGGEGASAAPPAQARYGRLVSFVRYCYYLLDFQLGYWLKITPLLKQGRLVIGERWYNDVIISPQRYGFALPGWLLKAGARLVPEPDFVILLKADPAAIHRRKPELGVDQIRDQLARMEEFTRGPHGGHIVDTGGAIEDAVTGLASLVQEASAVNARQHIDLRAFPSHRNVKVWVDRREKLSQALHLYHPYSRAGTVVKAFIASAPLNAGRFLLTGRPSSAERLRFGRLGVEIRSRLKNESLTISYSTGTPGPHRKLTAQASNGAEILAYIKISSAPAVRQLLDNEARVLHGLRDLHMDRISFPDVLDTGICGGDFLLFTSAPPVPGRQRGVTPDADDVRLLSGLARHKRGELPITEMLGALQVGNTLSQAIEVQAEAVPVLQEARDFLQRRFAGHGVITSFAHGDYAPWNTLRLADDSLYVFDWEYARSGMPVLTDLFHFIFMPLRLVEGTDPVTAVDRLCGIARTPGFEQLLNEAGVGSAEISVYFLLYLLLLAGREMQGAGGSVSKHVLDCIIRAGELADVDPA